MDTITGGVGKAGWFSWGAIPGAAAEQSAGLLQVREACRKIHPAVTGDPGAGVKQVSDLAT